MIFDSKPSKDVLFHIYSLPHKKALDKEVLYTIIVIKIFLIITAAYTYL